jgi:hypothetical protein
MLAHSVKKQGKVVANACFMTVGAMMRAPHLARRLD